MEKMKGVTPVNVKYKKSMHIIAAAAIAVILLLFAYVDVEAATYKNIGDGNITIKDSNTYEIGGTTEKNHITVEKGNPTITINGLKIDLCNEQDDGKSKEAAPISIEEGCSVTLIVKGDNRLEGGNNTGIGANWGYAGINIEKGASLTIKGDAGNKLVVYGGGNYGGSERGAAAIGSNSGDDMGTLTIEGGLTIEAHGAVKAAGIGSGCDAVAGDITIKGGTITASGGRSAAGIGCGDSVGTGDGGNCNNITITGGTITATGGQGAAGIGGSDGGDVKGTIKITGGTITATGGEEGAGIGGGLEGYVSGILIENGNITATGGRNGAGIGGGNAKGGGDGGDVGTLKITGGTITAYGGGGANGNNGDGGAGIGGGDGGEVDTFEIVEGGFLSLNITAYGGSYGAGIGSASGESVSHTLEKIWIKLNGGTIKAVGGNEGAGIGGGDGPVNNIVIEGRGTIEATGTGEAAAIGAGEREDGGDITIKGIAKSRPLKITATAKGIYTAVIGGEDSNGETIKLSNADITINSNVDRGVDVVSSSIGNGLTAGSMGDIIIENCKIVDSSSPRRKACMIGAGSDSDVGNIIIKDSEVSGGTIGATYCSDLIGEVKVDSIIIENSEVHASNTSSDLRAAIGAGLYTGVKEITINNSIVSASSSHGAGIGGAGYESDSKGDPVRWVGGACGDITITNSRVTATGRDGAAGIGGGWGTSVGDITIKGCSKVTAESHEPRYGNQGGAGIGGGYAVSTGTIKIENCSEVIATGCGYSAGIGGGGADSSATTWWDATCHSIILKNSTVTATGGTGSAGIGTGKGTQFSLNASISIDDCTVTATGGEKGAGIGAGANAAYGSGGEACDIFITGKSKVSARGGEGGAGIGGGYGGGSDIISIHLDETTYDSSTGWKYYVEAHGGYGGAGIGGGGEHGPEHDGLVLGTEGHGADSIRIHGGYVHGHGGPAHENEYAGAAAGIGGGGRGGRLEEFIVTGGYIDAESGSPKTANGIGSGDNDITPLLKDGKAKISGGTIVGGLSDEFSITIDGGSVMCNTLKAKRSDGTNVYRTLMQTGVSYYKLSDLNTSLRGYYINDVFSQGEGKVYLYLPEGTSDNSSTATYTHDGKKRSYYGKTGTEGTSWIKMDGTGTLSFVEPDPEPASGTEFILKIQNDEQLKEGTNIEFSVKDNSGVQIVEDGTDRTMPDAQVVLKSADRTEYTVTAKTTNLDSEMYWEEEGTYSGRISKVGGQLTITGDPSKVYDGYGAEDPAYSYNGDGQVTFAYYTAEGTQLDAAPTNAGTYYVVASAAGTANYTAATAEKQFTIEKRPVTIDIKASESGTSATLTAYVFGAVDSPGEVSIKINDADKGTINVSNPDTESGICTGDRSFENVAADQQYKVEISYDDSQGNYTCTNDPVEKIYDKTRVKRTITVNNLTGTYGESGGKIVIDCGETGSLENDTITYEIISDEYKDSYGVAPTVTVDANGNVTYEKAGRAVVKVTVKNSAYEDAVAYSTINISKAPLTVTSYAYMGTDSDANRVTTVTYGSLNSISYGLEYAGFVKGDTSENFALGTLSAVPIPETTGVGSTTIGIQKNGKTVTFGGKTYDNLFISRNYDLTLTPGTVTINKAVLYVSADDKTIIYGTEPGEYTYSFGDADGNYGLMPWDKASDIVSSVGLKPGKAHYEYAPSDAAYENCIAVTLKEGITNYVFNDSSTASTVSDGDLTVERAYVNLSAQIASKTYDGQAISPVVTVTPAFQVPDGVELEPCPAYEITYNEVTEDGTEKALSSAPKDAGSYKAYISVEESDYYNSASTVVLFKIRKTHCDVEKPKIPDIRMKDGLTLSAQKLPAGWKWLNPDRELETGLVNAYAIYTPEDTRNYFSEICTISFTVYEKSGSGSYLPEIQKPTVEAGEGVKVTLSSDGTVATITVDPGYELEDVVLNGTSKGKVTQVKGLRTGDKLVVTATRNETEPTAEEILAALAGQELVARSKIVKMKDGRKAIRITWYDANEKMMEFDGVEIFRSTKRNSGYGKKPIFTSKTDKYYNTSIKAGTTYYYKVRGYVTIDGKKYYTAYSLKAIRTVT